MQTAKIHQPETTQPSNPRQKHDAFDEQYTAYQLNRSWLRRIIRRGYLLSAMRLCRGATLDFGCGIGEQLALLPNGSVGLEVNPATVAHCQKRGLPVRQYEPATDKGLLLDIQPGHFKTLLMSHVLEHLEDAAKILQQLVASAARLGIDRFVLIVPGIKGYSSDITHRTFITEDYLRTNGVFPPAGWKLCSYRRFPFNSSWIGKFFTHNELQIVFYRGA